MPMLEPDPEPGLASEEVEYPHHVYWWYWEYRAGHVRWRWYPWGLDVVNGEVGRWWEVWRAVGNDPFVKLRGHRDGEGYARRDDEWRFRPMNWKWRQP